MKKVLLINPPLKFIKQEEILNLIKEGNKNYDKGVIQVMLGHKDYSVKETVNLSCEYYKTLIVRIIEGDHNFKGKLKLFMELPNIFFND